jgi:hypothetical protein
MSEDLIRVGAIAKEFYGADTTENRRRVYANAARLPLFKMGGAIFMRRSTLDAVIEQREAAAMAAMNSKQRSAGDARP